MDWSRKHICSLASLCREALYDETTPSNQRAKFAVVFQLAKEFSTCPQAGGFEGVHQVLVAMCDLCREFSLQDCAGRCTWQEECGFMERHVVLKRDDGVDDHQ